jgi:hypothetical protein
MIVQYKEDKSEFKINISLLILLLVGSSWHIVYFDCFKGEEKSNHNEMFKKTNFLLGNKTHFLVKRITESC